MNGSIQDCLAALHVCMGEFRKGFQDNLGELERRPTDRPPALVKFRPAALTKALQLETAEGPSFIGLGHLQDGQPLYDVTQRLWTLSIEAMSFELNAKFQPTINLQVLALKGVLSTIYVECFAESLERLLAVDKDIFTHLNGKPQWAQSAAARSVALSASERFKAVAADAVSSLQRLGMAADIASLFPWRDMPALQVAPQSAGETINGVWMPTALAQHIRLQLAMKQADSMSASRRLESTPTKIEKTEAPAASVRPTAEHQMPPSIATKAPPAQFSFAPKVSPIAASVNLSVAPSAVAKSFRVADSIEAQSIENGQTVRLQFRADGGQIVELAVGHEILPKLYRQMWAVGQRAEQMRKSVGSQSIVESFKLMDLPTVSAHSPEKILFTMLTKETGPMVFAADRTQARHLAGALLFAADKEGEPGVPRRLS